MITSIAPVLDGNEIWLAAGGALLFATFPAGYYMLLPAFAAPIALMLAALVLRGAAVGLRPRSRSRSPAWDLAFALGSILAVLCQGLLLGGLIDGATGAGALPGDDPLGLVTPLGTICALGLIGGYGLIGAGWLVWKNGDAGTRVGRRAVQPLLALTAAMLALGGVWGAWNVPSAATLTVTAAMLAVLAAIGHALAAERGARLLVLTMVLFALGIVALAALLWRSLLPLDATLWDSLANSHALGLLMAGITIALPLVLVHQAYAFRGFRRRPRIHGRRPGAAQP